MSVTKTVKMRIGKTRILHILDTDPDLSYLGEYTNDIGPGVIVREHGEFYERIKTGMERDYNGRFIGKLPPEYSNLYGRDQLPGFKPSSNHIPHDPKNWSHVPRKNKSEVIRKYGSLKNADYVYALEDYRRMEDYNNNHWCCIGIRVETTIETSENDFKDRLINEVSSGGLWGIESDSGEDHFREIEGEEKEELKGILLAMGFQESEIEESFRNAELKEEW